MVADCTVRSTGTSHSCLAGEIPESRDPVFLRAADSEAATRARQKAGTESGAWTVALRSSPSRSGPVRAPEKKGTLTHRSQRHLNADGRTTVPTRRPSARTLPSSLRFRWRPCRPPTSDKSSVLGPTGSWSTCVIPSAWFLYGRFHCLLALPSQEEGVRAIDRE